MSIRTNELQQLTNIEGTDSILIDSTLAGTGRITLEQAAQFFAQGENAVSAALDTKADMELISGTNLLHNWYFVDPINQRGKTEYIGKGYTIDRWKADDKFNGDPLIKVTIDGLTMTINPSSNERCGIFQILDEPLSSYVKGKTVTMSLLTADGELYSGTGILPVTTQTTQIQIHIEGGWYMLLNSGAFSSNTTFAIWWHPHNTPTNISIKAVKLEEGARQTLAHKDADGNWVLNDPKPNKALERLKCQRYQMPGRLIAIPYSVINGNSYYFMPLPTTLRSNPTIVGDVIVLDANHNHVDITGKTIVVNEGVSVPPNNCVYVKVCDYSATGGLLVLPENSLLDANL